jgi:hypothetical protein
MSPKQDWEQRRRDTAVDLGDDACLNEDVTGAHLALDVRPVVSRLTVKDAGCHCDSATGSCPSSRNDRRMPRWTYGLFEAVSDFEA